MRGRSAARGDLPLRGHLDYPVAGQAVSDRLVVKGWCFSPGKQAVTATLVLNSAHARTLALDKRRPDVRHAFAHLDLDERCGFSDQLASQDVPFVDGAVVVSVEVRDAVDHVLTLGPVEVRLKDPADPDSGHLAAEQEVWTYHDRIEFDRSDEEFAAYLCGRADIQPTDAVLEIGCGAGRTGRHLAPRCRKWIGTDVAKESLENARAHLAAYPNVDLTQTNGYDLSPVPDWSVDVVYCTLIFMLLPEWDRFNYVAEAYRVLRPKGRLYIDTMNLLGQDAWNIFFRLSRLSPHARPSNLCKTATPQELEMYLQRVGFREIRVRSGAMLVEVSGRKA